MFGAGRDARIYAGPAVMTKPGAIIIVMATENKVSTTHILPDPGRNPAMEQIMARAELMPDAERESGINTWARNFVERCGSQPGEPPGGEFEPPDEPFTLASCMFAGPHRELFYNMAALSAAGKLCPVMVWLSGPSSNGKPDAFCVAWPVTFALAPYLDAVVDVREAL